MIKVKLDTKDKKILSELDLDPNMRISKLAKKIGLSRQVTKYRINKMILNNTFYNFYTLIDVTKLGYSIFRMYIRLKQIKGEQFYDLAKSFFDKYPIFWIASISGSFDLIIDLFAYNHDQFSLILSKILEENGTFIQTYETTVILEMDFYNYTYFLNEGKEINKIVMCNKKERFQLDSSDIHILQLIKSQSRLPYEKIGQMVGLTRNAVKTRIKKLQEKNIIAGYKFLVNFRHFNRQSFKVLIKYDNSKISQEKKFLNYLQGQDGILATLKLFGTWNLDIEIHVDDIKSLQEFIMNLRNKYDIVEDYSLIPVIEEYGVDFFPKNLF